MHSYAPAPISEAWRVVSWSLTQAYQELRLNDEMRFNDVMLTPVQTPLKHGRGSSSPPDTDMSNACTLVSCNTDMTKRYIERPRWEQHLDKFGWCYDTQV